MKHVLFLFFSLFFIFNVFAYDFPEYLEIPECECTYKETPDHQIVKHNYYTICYRESYEQAEFSAYKLTKEMLIKNTERSNRFKVDPKIKNMSASSNDYKNTIYDRGHLTPAADMCFSKLASDETFYMSNISPQYSLFNRGIWKLLEEKVRSWCNKFDTIYVISGPILNKPASEYGYIGLNKVSVPEYYYKVILVPYIKNDELIDIKAFAFILPNKEINESFWNYQVTVDYLEKQTNLNFFYKLDDELENKIEAELPNDYN